MIFFFLLLSQIKLELENHPTQICTLGAVAIEIKKNITADDLKSHISLICYDACFYFIKSQSISFNNYHLFLETVFTVGWTGFSDHYSILDLEGFLCWIFIIGFLCVSYTEFSLTKIIVCFLNEHFDLLIIFIS